MGYTNFRGLLFHYSTKKKVFGQPPAKFPQPGADTFFYRMTVLLKRQRLSGSIKNDDKNNVLPRGSPFEFRIDRAGYTI